MKVLLTGAAGFIGFHVGKYLLNRGESIVGLDNLNDYYDVSLKEDRLRQLEEIPGFRFVRLELSDEEGIAQVFNEHKPDRVIHLAAQAGVRHSLSNPKTYIQSNVLGFANVLEGCRHTEVQHLTYASSSSVYGSNTSMPFSVHNNTDHPVSLYAASKKSNELMAHAYSHLFGLPTTGLRFFTVYGPWGRPDMALFIFTKAILTGRPINVFNYGRMRRDFTYIDDIVAGVVKVHDQAAQPNPEWSGDRPDPGTSKAPFRIYNIGNHKPVELLHFIEVLESSLGKTAKKRMLPMQLGDVPATCADIKDLVKDVGFAPSTSIEEGIPLFVEWYRKYYSL